MCLCKDWNRMQLDCLPDCLGSCSNFNTETSMNSTLPTISQSTVVPIMSPIIDEVSTSHSLTVALNHPHHHYSNSQIISLTHKILVHSVLHSLCTPPPPPPPMNFPTFTWGNLSGQEFAMLIDPIYS